MELAWLVVATDNGKLLVDGLDMFGMGNIGFKPVTLFTVSSAILTCLSEREGQNKIMKNAVKDSMVTIQTYIYGSKPLLS